jgi:hypothetical protein
MLNQPQLVAWVKARASSERRDHMSSRSVVLQLLKVLPLGVVLPLIIGAASVDPEDVVSHLSKWLLMFGIHDVPEWLKHAATDQWVIYGFLCAALVYAVAMWRQPILRVLRMEGQISLFEAATRTYEQTRNSEFSIFPEGITNSSEEILCWYCDQMTRHQNGKEPPVRLFGNRPPSRQKEEIYMAALSRYDFAVEGRAIILQERNGAARYENLSVSAKEVDAAIRELASRKA